MNADPILDLSYDITRHGGRMSEHRTICSDCTRGHSCLREKWLYDEWRRLNDDLMARLKRPAPAPEAA